MVRPARARGRTWEPRIVGRLGRQLGGGSVLITGTNGKTTASRLLASMLTAADRAYVHNREGLEPHARDRFVPD